MREKYQDQLEMLDVQLATMGRTVEAAISSCIAVLESGEEEAAKQIAEGDDAIDALERDVEALALRLMLTQQPVAADLRRVTAALKIAGDMERIGDQAADIAEIIGVDPWEPDSGLARDLAELARKAAGMVRAAVDAYAAHDARRANSVIASDAQVNAGFDRVRAAVVQMIREREGSAAAPVNALLIAKHLERVGDHAKNICFWVEYEVTGTYKNEQLV